MTASASSSLLEPHVQVASSVLDALHEEVAELKYSTTILERSVSELQYDNARLQKRLDLTQSKFTTLQRNSGARFPQFIKLPVELRRLIWQFACCAPQIHLITSERPRLSHTNSILLACKEAQNVAHLLQMDYYEFHNYVRQYDQPLVSQHCRSHINLEQDVVFYTEDDYFPQSMLWKCGQCKRTVGYPTKPSNDIPSCKRCCLATTVVGNNLGRDVPRMGVMYSEFTHPELADPDDGNFFGHKPGSILFLYTYQVKELFLVVGDVQTPYKTSDLAFSTPQMTPLQMSKSPHWGDSRSFTEFHRPVSWTMLANAIKKEWKMFKLERAANRAFMITHDNKTEEELELNDTTTSLSNWDIPTIRFVEAV